MIAMSTGKVRKRTWGWCPACEKTIGKKALTHGGKCPACAGKVTKRTAYEYTVLVDGKRQRKQFPSQAEALEALDALKEESKRPKAPDAPSLTLAEALTQCLSLKARRARATVSEYERIAEHLKAVFGADTPLSEITASRISEYKAQRLAAVRTIGDGNNAVKRRLSAAAINRPLALLRQVLRLGRKLEALAKVPEMELEKEPQGRLRWLTPEEAGQLLDACRKSRNPALADLVEFAMFTGCRRGEALGLTWDRVDRARGVIRLETTKSGHRREVPLSANADAVLARRWTGGAKGYVFGTRNWNAFRSAWEVAVEAAKLDDFRFHDLRHTFASWLVQRGRSLKEVQELLGHRSMAMTMRYAHLAPDHLRAAAAVLDDVLPAPANGLAQDGRSEVQPTNAAPEVSQK